MDRIARESVDLFLETVSAKHSFALIQERGSLQGDSGTKRGHVIICDESHDRTPAVVLHRALVPLLLCSEANPFCAGIRVRTRDGTSFVLLSVYLPSTGHCWEAYVKAIGVVDATVARLRAYAKGPCHLILGGDANCEVCEDGRFVGPAVSGPQSRLREALLPRSLCSSSCRKMEPWMEQLMVNIIPTLDVLS